MAVTASRGLSPRVRGTRPQHPVPVLRSDLSPRVRGNPPDLGRSDERTGLSPRVRGNHGLAGHVGVGRGSIPRVRGNRDEQGPTDRHVGSIPACAGEPSRRFRGLSPRRVYPRVCGGTHAVSDFLTIDQGLSPRVRGNHVRGAVADIDVGSIPACAGEPTSSASSSRSIPVYPRVCGGTLARPRPHTPTQGLSPRVRGNRERLGKGRVRQGSIPACAGEP